MASPWRPPLHVSIDNGYCGCLVVIDYERKYLPLTKVSAHATLLASTSRTTLTQTFKNPTAKTIKESRYVFPLFDGVTVVAFTCTIGKKVIQGVVKSKPDAKKEFDAAVARGEQAGLMEQSDRASDVFTTKLGNVGPNEEAKVELTYLGELKHDAEVDGLRYTMPTNIAPRYADDLVVPIPAHHSNVLEQATLSVTIDVDLATGAAIKSVQSPSHPISVNIGTRSTHPNDDPSLQYASASLTRSDITLDKDIIVQVCAKGLGNPTAVLETHSTIPSRRAIMATLVPRFNLAVEKPEVVFICDRSGSMDSGSRLPNLIESLQVFLKSLPVGVLFNICSFGSSHAFLWPKSQPYNQTTLDQAIAHVKTFTANFGGTRIREPLEATFGNRERSRNLEAFLMTDGETWDEQATFEVINAAVKESQGAIRVFALGVGADASHSLIEGVSRAGRGFSQSVGENEKMNKKVVRMLKGALTPHINDYNLEIKYEKENDEDFELVEKVSDCTIVDNGEATPAEKRAQATISLHDTSVNDEDLEMPDSKALALPDLPTPTYLQAPHDIPPLFPFNRTSVYVLLSETRAERKPKSVVLKGTSPQGPLELEIPVHVAAEKGTTIHQLAARKAVQDLEEGRGWIYDAKLASGKMLSEAYAMQMSDVAKQAGVKLGVEYQVAGKWCSFVAVKKKKEAKKELELKEDAPRQGITNNSLVERFECDMDSESCSGLSDESDDDIIPDLSDNEPEGQVRHMRGAGAPAPRRAFAAKMARKSAPISQGAAIQQQSAAATAASVATFGAPAMPQSYGFGAAAPAGGGLFGTSSPPVRESCASNMSFGGRLGAVQQSPGSSPQMNQPQQSLVFSPQMMGQQMQQMQQMQQQSKQPLQGISRTQLQGRSVSPSRRRSSRRSSLTRSRDVQGGSPGSGTKRMKKTSHGSSAAEHDDDDEDDDDGRSPLETIIALQTFSGSWAWSARLERILGVTQAAAGAHLSGRSAEATATLCAVAFLQAKVADEEEVWELVVDKARSWLASTLPLGEADIEALEAKAKDILS
ncbi:hypothetical protein PWT90_01974 [Aphanocladium album]|nr:hypothetical protein PWT90_01974 [Aphanocladium album]